MDIPQIGTCGTALLAYGSSREEVVKIPSTIEANAYTARTGALLGGRASA